ncbi:MAG: thiopeptide-type bacteriocin biosynthesis protein, partial [Candidatus Eremiobacteraeota bacterium]|nr:thiopeptide-type bacteriocin biosynthesis protein [Candidatus Eremiobacteraeota bacterium]
EPVVVPDARRFGPGSAWIYARLYLGSQTMDDFLTSAIAPFVETFRERRLIERWFFLRYGDPQSHIRLRLHAADGHAALARERFFESAETWLASDRITRYALDTYEPEYERYGGAAKIERIERFFELDSDACLEIIRTAGASTDARVAAAAGSFDALVRALAIDEIALEQLDDISSRRLSAGDRSSFKRLSADGTRSPKFDAPPATLLRGCEGSVRDLLHVHCNRLGLDAAAELRTATLLRALVVSRRARRNQHA